jgi:hypothetical protein
LGLLGPLPAAFAAAPSAQIVARPPVVILAVPGLQWSDFTSMPALRALAESSSVAELSVKTAATVTRCPAGLLAVSAGNRTAAPGTSCAVDMTTWPALRQLNSKTRYRADVGAFGSALVAARVRTAAVSAAAEPMLADRAGHVSVVVPTLAAALNGGGVVGMVDSALYDASAAGRPAARAEIDARVSSIVSALPTAATLFVAGVSDFSTGPTALHALVVHGPGWAHTELRSSASGRAPYAQLIDLAPTILRAEGVAVPSSMVGRPMQQSGARVPSIGSFVEDNRHAEQQQTLGQRVFLVLGIVVMTAMVLAVLTLPYGRRVAMWLARIAAPAPMLIFAANGVPWWRWGQPWYAVMVVAGCLLLAALTGLVALRSLLGALLLVPALTFAVLGLDQLTGSSLQLSSPLGDNPLSAARFSGMGNLDFAAFAASALLVSGLVGGYVVGRRSRLAGAICAAAVVVVALVIDGAPSLGDDIGGVLALLPAGLVLVALVARVRITIWRAVVALAAAVAVAVLIALADYSRPASQQTHVGRFVGQVLHGGAGTEVRRKFDASVGSIGLTVATFLVAFALVTGWVARHRIRAALTEVPGLVAAAASLVVLGALGMALNDSGVAIPAMVVVVAFGAIYGSGVRSPGEQGVATGDASASSGVGPPRSARAAARSPRDPREAPTRRTPS